MTKENILLYIIDKINCYEDKHERINVLFLLRIDMIFFCTPMCHTTVIQTTEKINIGERHLIEIIKTCNPNFLLRMFNKTQLQNKNTNENYIRQFNKNYFTG